MPLSTATKALKQVPKNKHGKYLRNGVKLEPHEEATAKFLTLYGFTVDVIRPLNTPKVNNPDILMNGTFWEMKAPMKFNENTLKVRMKKASKQAKRIIFDLRNVERGQALFFWLSLADLTAKS